VTSKPLSNIADLRRKVGLTQLQLSQKVGVTETTIANWEKSRGGGLELIERFVRLCEALNCQAKDLISYPSVLESKEPWDTSLASIRADLDIDEPVRFSLVEQPVEEISKITSHKNSNKQSQVAE